MDPEISKIIKISKKDHLVLAVALFGSYARGEKHRDIYVCIFLKENVYTPKQLSGKKMKYTVENKKYDIQIFQQLPLYIQKRILKEAKVLYCKNEDQLYDLYFL